MRDPHNEPLTAQDIAADAPRGSATPERRCVLTGRHEPRDALLRLALGPEGADGFAPVLPDAHARAPGRGAWVAVTHVELAQALANGKLRGALARAFKTGKLAIPDDLPERAEAALRRALTDRLGLESRAGRLMLGSDRIARSARDGKVTALYHAEDASEDGTRKLDQAWRVGREAEGTGLAGERLPLDRMALSVALGRDNVVHLALTDHGSAQRVSIPLQRLLNFLGVADGAVETDASAPGRSVDTHAPAAADAPTDGCRAGAPAAS